MRKKTLLIFGSKVVKFRLTKASYHNSEDFVSPVWWNDHFWWSGVLFTKFWNFYTKSNVFIILRNIFIFYSRHPFNHELSVFICFIVMDKLIFCFLSWTFKFSFDLKLGAPKNRKLRKFCPLEIFKLFCTKLNFWRKSCNLSFFKLITLYLVHFHHYLRLH